MLLQPWWKKLTPRLNFAVFWWLSEGLWFSCEQLDPVCIRMSIPWGFYLICVCGFGVFLKECRWQDVAPAVSWCDGYDEGQGALASTPKLWSCSVYTYKHYYFLTHTQTQTHNFSTAWHVADDYSSQRKCTKETHTSLLICLTTATYTLTCKHLISRMSAHHPVTHTHLRLQTAPKTQRKCG